MNTSLVFIALILSTSLIYIINKLFLSNGIIDGINNRSSHNVVATRSGGVSVFISIFIISSYFYISGNTIFDFSILVPLSLLVAIGSYDDIYSIDFKLKFIFQIIAAKIIPEA